MFDAQNAQHQQWLQQAAHARAEAQQRDALVLENKLQQDRAVLAEKFGDDWTDPGKQRALLTNLAEVGAALGYSEQLMSQADAGDYLALKTAADWKAKADKYDQLMSDRSKVVTAAKNAPRVATPGTSRDQQGRYAAKRDAAWARVQQSRGKDGDAAAALLETMGVNL